MRKLRRLILGFLLAAALAKNSPAQLPDVVKGTLSVELQAVATGLSAPLDLVSAADGSGRLFIVEQGGRVKILQNGSVNAAPFLDVAGFIAAGGEKGLLGLAFHPGFANPASPGFRKIYTYTTVNPSGPADFTVPHSAPFDNQSLITEWQVSLGDPNVVDPATRRDVLRIDHPQSNHNGGKIAFRPSDGYLYIATGDGGAGNDVGSGHTPNLGNGQDITNLLGKILRIDPLAPALTPGSADPASANGKYRIPVTNPFRDAPGLDEIYAYGLRNPFRFSFDPTTDRLLAGDVGQGSIEEVDLIESGRNYGWNRKEGTFLFNPATGQVSVDPNPNPAFTNPIFQYDHGDGISVIGGYVYRGSAVPALAGKYLFGDFFQPSTNTGRVFAGDFATGVMQEVRLGNDSRPLGAQIKAFGTDDAGEIYLVADNGGTTGQILKVVPIPAVPALLNLSTRARVEADDGGLAIAGFIVTGSAPKTFVVRGLGPSLAVNGQPLPGRLANPALTLQNESGAQIDANDDWMTGARAGELSALGLAPSAAQEAAIVATLAPGAYTATMRGVGGGAGIGLVEIFDVAQSAPANAVNLSTRGRVQAGDNAMIGGLDHRRQRGATRHPARHRSDAHRARRGRCAGGSDVGVGERLRRAHSFQR